MSFGSGIGDILGTAQVAYKLWKYCYKVARDAPEGFKHLVSEISTLSQSLRFLGEEAQDPNSTLVKSGEDRIRMMNEMIIRVTATLTELEKIAKRYEKLGTTSSSSIKQTWAKFKWSVDASDLDGLRNRLVYHNGIISLLLISCGNSSPQRIEATVTKLERRFSEIGDMINKFGTEAPGISAINAQSSKIALLQLNAALRKSADVGQRKWSSIGVDEWIQAGRWWLMKAQTELSEIAVGDRTLPPQCYLNLMKASWILIDVIARHPQLNLLNTDVRSGIEILAEIIRSELGNIETSTLLAPDFNQLLGCDLTMWESQTKGPALQATIRLDSFQTGTPSWMAEDEHIVFRRFGTYQSKSDAIPIPCIVLVMLHKTESTARIVVGNQCWVTLEEYSARTIRPQAIHSTVKIEHQVLTLGTTLDGRHLCVIWDALGEYQLHRDTDHNEPQVLTPFVILVAVKHNDYEVVERVRRDEDDAGSQSRPAVGFSAKLRLAAENLAAELSNNRVERSPSWIPLFVWAAKEGHHAVAAALLDRIDIVTTKQDIGWWYSLYNVVTTSNVQAMKLFLFEGRMDVNEVQRKGGFTVLQEAARGGHEVAVDQLLRAGADVNAVGVGRNDVALEIAARGGYEAVVNTLLKAGANINADGPLQAAAAGGHEVVLDMLIEAGADINATWWDGRTAFQAAAGLGHEAVVEMLLKAGAHISTAATTGGWPSYIEADGPLQAAVAGGHKGVVGMLLKAGADINLTGRDGRTALLTAAELGLEAMVEMLLKAGANINPAATIGGLLFGGGAHIEARGALEAAAKGGHEAVVGQLIKADANINAKLRHDQTALITAVEQGHEAVVDMLINAGADVNVKGEWGITALRAAARGGNEVMVQKLRMAGAIR